MRPRRAQYDRAQYEPTTILDSIYLNARLARAFTVEAQQQPNVSEGLLYAALGMAAVISFQRARPVVMRLQGKPYRLVTVEFVNSTTKPPANAI